MMGFAMFQFTWYGSFSYKFASSLNVFPALNETCPAFINCFAVAGSPFCRKQIPL